MQITYIIIIDKDDGQNYKAKVVINCIYPLYQVMHAYTIIQYFILSAQVNVVSVFSLFCVLIVKFPADWLAHLALQLFPLMSLSARGDQIWL